MCTCGNRGCVAVLATASAVIRQLGEEGIEVASPPTSSSSCNAATRVAMHHVREAGRVLGAALAAVVSVVAPSGDRRRRRRWPTRPSRCWPASARASTSAASALATRELRILTSRLGPRAGVVGVTTLALEHVLEPANVDALLARRGLAA